MHTIHVRLPEETLQILRRLERELGAGHVTGRTSIVVRRLIHAADAGRRK